MKDNTKVYVPKDGPQPPTTRLVKSAESRRRVGEVITWLRKGNSRKKCVEKVMQKYDLSEVMAKKYVHDAFVDIFEASKVADMPLVKETYIDRIEELLSDAISSNNMVAATKLMDMLNRIQGLYVDKQEVDMTVKDMEFKFGDEQ